MHLEVAFSLDTLSFNTISQMISIGGIPEEIISDNETYITAVNKELLGGFTRAESGRNKKGKVSSWYKMVFQCSLVWVFESMIKSAKKAINKWLKNARVTDEELLSVVIGAESLVNLQPITYLSACPKDDCPLTANHFFRGNFFWNFALKVEKWIYHYLLLKMPRQFQNFSVCLSNMTINLGILSGAMICFFNSWDYYFYQNYIVYL